MRVKQGPALQEKINSKTRSFQSRLPETPFLIKNRNGKKYYLNKYVPGC